MYAPLADRSKATLLPTDAERSDGASAASCARAGERSDGFGAATCGPGPLLITAGAALFACTNAASTAYFRSGGTVVTLYLIRCIVVWPVNGAIVAAKEGRQAAVDVMFLRTGRGATTRVLLFRSMVFSVMSLFMCFGYILLTFNDSFTVMKGTDMLTAVLITRFCMGRSERLSPRELACGVLTLAGIALIAQPPLLFDALRPVAVNEPPAPRPSAAGLACVVVAGALGASVGVLTRVLSQAGGPHDGYASPAMQLSYLMVAMFVWFGGLGIAGRATGLADSSLYWAWSGLVKPRDWYEWVLIGLHCAFVLSAQLCFSLGYRTTRAGIAAFLQLTELAWVYVLDVVALGEPTSVFATLGTALVFCSAVAAARSAAKK